MQKQTSSSSSELLPEQPVTVATLHIESQDYVTVGNTSSKPLMDLAHRMQEWSYSPVTHGKKIHITFMHVDNAACTCLLTKLLKLASNKGLLVKKCQTAAILVSANTLLNHGFYCTIPTIHLIHR